MNLSVVANLFDIYINIYIDLYNNLIIDLFFYDICLILILIFI